MTLMSVLPFWGVQQVFWPVGADVTHSHACVGRRQNRESGRGTERERERERESGRVRVTGCNRKTANGEILGRELEGVGGV